MLLNHIDALLYFYILHFEHRRNVCDIRSKHNTDKFANLASLIDIEIDFTDFTEHAFDVYYVNKVKSKQSLILE